MQRIKADTRAVEITPIRYCYAKGNDQSGQIEFLEMLLAIMRNDQIVRWQPQVIRLGQLNDQGKKRPPVTEFICELKTGLIVQFRQHKHGIEQAYTTVPIEQHIYRQVAAYVVSETLGVNICPISVLRQHPMLGLGSMTAMIEGESIIYLEVVEGIGKTRVSAHRRRATALAEVYLFDYIIGSGQRGMSSYLLDINGRIVSQYHHEAFSFDQDALLEIAFKTSKSEVSSSFWSLLENFSRNELRYRTLREKLEGLIGQELTGEFFIRFWSLVRHKKLGKQTISIVS